LLFVAQKLDRDTLKNIFSGEVGMHEVAKLKDLLETIEIKNEQFSQDARIKRIGGTLES